MAKFSEGQIANILRTGRFPNGQRASSKTMRHFRRLASSRSAISRQYERLRRIQEQGRKSLRG